MKINTTFVQRRAIQVDITPSQAIQGLRDEVTVRINKELESLKLPHSELPIPNGGFDYFYLNPAGTKVFGYHMEDRPPRETVTDVEIRWGVDGKVRALKALKELEYLGDFLA